MSTFFNDQWEVPGQFWGAPGSIKDNFEHDPDHFFSDFSWSRFGVGLGSLCDTLGASRTNFGTIWCEGPPAPSEADSIELGLSRAQCNARLSGRPCFDDMSPQHQAPTRCGFSSADAPCVISTTIHVDVRGALIIISEYHTLSRAQITTEPL